MLWNNKIPERAPGQPISESLKNSKQGGIQVNHIELYEAYFKDLLNYLDVIHIKQVHYYISTEAIDVQQ